MENVDDWQKRLFSHCGAGGGNCRFCSGGDGLGIADKRFLGSGWGNYPLAERVFRVGFHPSEVRRLVVGSGSREVPADGRFNGDRVQASQFRPSGFFCRRKRSPPCARDRRLLVAEPDPISGGTWRGEI